MKPDNELFPLTVTSGDSYTDTGFDINGAQPSADNPLGNPSYPSHTMSGGPNYIDFLTMKYNNSLVLSYNFAMSGATTSDSIVAAVGSDVHSFQQQVENSYKPKYSTPEDNNAPWSANDAVFLIFFGINEWVDSLWHPSQLADFFESIDLSYQSDASAHKVPTLLQAYFQYVDELHATGARNFLFVNVPPFNRSPARQARGAQDAATCSKSIHTYNSQLAQGVQNWSAANTDVRHDFVFSSSSIMS